VGVDTVFRPRVSKWWTLLLVVLAGSWVGAQTGPPGTPSKPLDSQSGTPAPDPAFSLAPCVQPAALRDVREYHGVFKKGVGYFGRKLERKTAPRKPHKPGATTCSLDAKEKFMLFLNDSLDPVSFVITGFSAGIDQAENNDPSFGQGAEGYGKRYGASFADQAADNFFREFFYPTIFRQDPRYFRIGEGTRKQRLAHAVGHTFVATSDSGRRGFNYSEWLGSVSGQVLSNVYRPGNRRGAGHTAEGAAIRLATDMGFDIIREFLPDIFLKLNLPLLRRLPMPKSLGLPSSPPSH
jgi:hypothetical protein